MLMKVFRHGVGRGSSVINYVMDAKDAKRQHSPPEVLRGDPGQVKQLIDSTGRKWKYTSGVLSWAPEDKVTLEQERELMDSFESHAFAGMEPDQYSILWVRHSHAGRHEMHFVISRTELRTDKALNPCPPGWDKQYNPLCELWNRRNNWARPDEAKRARLVSPGVTIESYRSGTVAEVRTAVTNALIEGVKAGVINNRGDIVENLEGIGFAVPRQGKDYITIEVPQSNDAVLNSTKKKPQRIRLKGALYAESWNAAEQRLGLGEQVESPNGRTDARDAADNARRIALLEQRVAEIRKARAAFNTKRFGRRGEAQQRDAGRDVPELASNPKTTRCDKSASHCSGLHSSHSPDIPLVSIREEEARGVATAEYQVAAANKQSFRLANSNQQCEGSAVSYFSERDEVVCTANKRWASRSTIGELDDVRTQNTNFTDVIKDARGARRAERGGAAPISQGRQVGKRTHNSSATTEPLGRKLECCCSNFREVVERLQQFLKQQMQRGQVKKRDRKIGMLW